MTPAAEKFRQQLQKELGITIGPKEPLLALWLAQQKLLEEMAAQQQKLVAEFEAVLGRNQTAWSRPGQEPRATESKRRAAGGSG
jgi:hypothetical protein